MKNYRVSLAAKAPCNFEAKVSANSEEEALKKALEKHENGEFNGEDIADLLWNDAELDINQKTNINDSGNGIFIEEIKL